MGEVWKAQDPRLGREVAIKVLSAEVSVDSDRLRRFEKEARSASSLNHPNIVTVYDIGQADAVSYIAMELVEGKTLRELLLTGPLPIKRLLQIAAQIADGLARAHDAGIVHRDLKPENVMVTGDGRVKILDFGLAKVTQPDSDSGRSESLTVTRGTEPGIVMGTVGYMSPEQASGHPVDYRSDQFSLGSVLYEMATGKRAFEGKTKPEILAAIIRDEPQPIAALAPKTPAPLRWIVERCLAKEPRERYASTEDLASELRTLRDHLSEAMLSSDAIPAARRRLAGGLAVWLSLSTLVAGVFVGKLLWRTESSPPSFQRVTFRRGEVPAARFSPDGQTIVYSFSAGGEPTDIYSMRVGNPEFRAHGLPGAKLLAVSSSGEMAVALGWHWGGPNVGAGTLARVSLAGGAPRQLLENAMDADWAPDGKSLAVLRYVDPGRRIEFPLGKVLYETKNFPFIVEPRVSPRGDAVAFLELDRPNGVLSVQIVDRAGKRRKLSDGWSSAQGLAWSKEGKEIWFAATRSGFARALYAVTLSRKERLVARFPGGLTLHDISPTGRVLLTQENTRREVAGRLYGDASDRDLTWLDYSAPADLSADGKRFLFLEAGEGSGARPSLWLGGAAGSAPVRLGDGSNASSLSPDGKWVAALRTRSDGPNELMLIPTGAGEERRVGLAGVNPLGTKWLPDGERLLIEGQAPGGKMRSYVAGFSGGAPRPITPEGVTSEAMTPDGKWVLCSAKGQAMLYPVENGEPRSLPRPPNPEVLEYLGTLAWADDDHTVFVAESGVPARILRLDIHTWQKTLWKEVGPADTAGVRMVQPVLITPDGKSYVYTFRRVLSDLYLVDGLK